MKTTEKERSLRCREDCFSTIAPIIRFNPSNQNSGTVLFVEEFYDCTF
jgi:hypothetical protein